MFRKSLKRFYSWAFSYIKASDNTIQYNTLYLYEVLLCVNIQKKKKEKGKQFYIFNSSLELFFRDDILSKNNVENGLFYILKKVIWINTQNNVMLTLKQHGYYNTSLMK